MVKRLFALLFLSHSFLISYSQTGTIRGFVYEKESGEPLLFVNVILKGTSYGVASDVNGYYSITKIAPGSYTLLVTSLGFDSLQVPVTVGSNEIVTKKLYLVKGSVKLTGVEISAQKEEQRTEVKMSVTKITPREIKQVPAAGGEPDLAQYLQVLPGVVFTGDQGGQLYIRGGTPIQNKVLLDGMVIYNPFHSIGLFSVFDTDILKNVDVYTGGFGAEFGGRISSIMDISTRDGNKKRLSGKFSASTFNAKLLLEGPISKPKSEGGGSSSFILSGKTSYLDKSSKVFYTYIDTGGLPYSFTDLYGKAVFNSANGSKVNFFGFNFSDQVNYKFVSDLNWKAFGAGSSFVFIPGNSPLLIDGTLAYSQYKINLTEADEKPRSSLINGFNFGINFTYFLNKDEIKYGLEVLGFKTDFIFYNYANRKLSQQENTTEFGAYMRYKKVLGKKVVLDPSLRLHYYASLAEFAVEPRIGIKYNVADKFRLKAAAGLYAQNFMSAVSDRDVVNLFYGFLSGSDDLPEEFKGEEVTSKLQHARHVLAGFEYDLPRHFELNIEAYIKDFNQLTNVNRDKLYDDNAANANQPDYLKKSFIVEEGTAKGVDFLLKYDYKKIYFWFVYSLTFVDRFDGIREYVPHFDRRHNINLVTSYTFGKNLDWEVNARWNMGSGFPFTQTQGFYSYLNFQQGLNVNYTSANGILGLLYGEINEGRLPYYHRLDISVKKTFVLGKNSILEAIGSVINVYDRENIFYFDRITGERVNQLPILPSIGLSFTF
ncbi:MAG: carboxypeptidase-like regulatory domain-containing protein [Bacteroidia bacterium]